MNKVGIYYAYWTRNWSAGFSYFVPKVAKMGFDILEVNSDGVLNMPRAEREKLKAEALENNIELTYCVGVSRENDIASKDAETRARGIDYLKRTLQAIGEMGGKSLGGIIYGAWPATMPEGEEDKRPYLENSINSVKEIIKTAEDMGIDYNLEVVNRFEQFLFNTVEEAVNYVDMVGSPNIKVMLDTFHMNIEEDSIRQAVLTAGNKLGHVHIGENNRRPPGQGNIPWDELAAALKEIGYEGAVVMEPFLKPGGEVGRDIRVWRDMSIGVNLDAEAKKALDFIRGKLA